MASQQFHPKSPGTLRRCYLLSFLYMKINSNPQKLLEFFNGSIRDTFFSGSMGYPSRVSSPLTQMGIAKERPGMRKIT